MSNLNSGMPRLYTVAEAAEVLRTTTNTVNDWRKRGTGPAYVRVGGRRILYTEDALLAFLSEGAAA